MACLRHPGPIVVIALASLALSACGGADVDRDESAPSKAGSSRVESEREDPVASAPEGYELQRPTPKVPISWVNYGDEFAYPPTIGAVRVPWETGVADYARQQVAAVVATFPLTAVESTRTVRIDGEPWTRVEYTIPQGAAGTLRAITLLREAEGTVQSFGVLADDREARDVEPDLRAMVGTVAWDRIDIVSGSGQTG